MIDRLRGLRLLLSMLALVLMAGCAITNWRFAYKPGASVTASPKLPISVAVFSFKDGTEDFTSRGSVFNRSLHYNLAKTDSTGQITDLSPDLWSKAFADDMAASGEFKSVRFVYAQSELLDEEIYIEGTLKRATLSAYEGANEFALVLRALRRADKQLIWEKEVSKTWKNTPGMYEGCGRLSAQCNLDLLHAAVNRAMQDLFVEARGDLTRTLALLYRNRPGANATSVGATATPLRQGSVDEEVERILKEQ